MDGGCGAWSGAGVEGDLDPVLGGGENRRGDAILIGESFVRQAGQSVHRGQVSRHGDSRRHAGGQNRNPVHIKHEAVERTEVGTEDRLALVSRAVVHGLGGFDHDAGQAGTRGVARVIDADRARECVGAGGVFGVLG